MSRLVKKRSAEYKGKWLNPTDLRRRRRRRRIILKKIGCNCGQDLSGSG
jgi:hypothetical protein